MHLLSIRQPAKQPFDLGGDSREQAWRFDNGAAVRTDERDVEWTVLGQGADDAAAIGTAELNARRPLHYDPPVRAVDREPRAPPDQAA
jgi:hypothetical protein